jgi:hypothetical protein
MDARIGYVEADVRELTRRLNALEGRLQSERDMRFFVWSTIVCWTLTALAFGLLWHHLGWL